MESYQQELAQIKTILKNNPKGMTVTDIAREIHINRNSVAKYLDILLISGHAEMVTFGPAKVFFPSSRIPLSALLNFTHDYIVLLDKELRFFQSKRKPAPILEHTTRQYHRSNLSKDSPLPSFKSLSLSQNARRALDGKELTIEKRYGHRHRGVVPAESNIFQRPLMTENQESPSLSKISRIGKQQKKK